MKLEFEISSNYEAGREIQRSISEQVHQFQYDADSQFAIRLALEEALTNAIKHGNGLDPNKKVRVTAVITARRTEITVEDEGRGFSRQSVPDPTEARNLSRPSGRGVLLIESYMNTVAWEKEGRRLRMARENAPVPAPPRKR